MGITAKAAVGGGAVTEFWEMTLWTLWGGNLQTQQALVKGSQRLQGALCTENSHE